MDTHLRQAIDSAVTAVWGQGARVSQIVSLAGDASSRSYARLHLDGSVPATAVVMGLAGSALPLSSEEVAVFAEPLKELPYLNMYRFLQPLWGRVPEVYYDGQKDGVFLPEDCGDVFLREAPRPV